MKKLLHVIALVAILSISAIAQPAQNVVTMQNAATATGNGTAIKTASQTTNAMFGAVGFQITGTFSATITFEVTFDGSTWVEVMATNLSDDTRATTATAAGAYSVLLNGALQCRARISAYTSGSVTVKGRLIPGLVSRVIQAGGGGGGSGDVVGPASATDNAVARFNTTTGKLIQNSVVTVGDTGDVAGIAALTFTGVLTGGSAPTTITDSAGKILSAALNTVQPAQGGTGITSLGTGIATALGVNIGSAGAPVLFNGAGGTPSSLTLTNATGLPISTGLTGLGTGVATFLATPSSANLASAVTDETGSGSLVFGTSPTFSTGVTFSSAPITISGNISSAAWTTNGIRIKGVTATLTDTTSSGTVAAAYTNNLGGNTIAASSATTFTDYYTAFITQPTAGTNVTFTNRWALGLSGNLSAAGTIVQTSASATAFESGPNGSTNPVFRLVNNVASAATGLSITGNAAGSGVTLTALSSGTNENIVIVPKGSGTVEQRNGATAQILHVYHNFTDASNYRRLSVSASAGEIALDTAGTGGGSNLTIRNGAGGRVVIRPATGDELVVFQGGGGANVLAFTLTSGSQAIKPISNNVMDLGGSSSQRFKTAFLQTGVLIGASGTLGTSGVGVLAISNGTVPTSSPADEFQVYSADSAAGDANAFARNEAGEVNRLTGLAARNSSSFAKTSDTTLANITGLTRNVEASRTYAFTAVLQSTAAATGGVKFSVSGTATATAISYEGILMNGAAVVAQTRATALDTTVCASTTSTAGTCTIRGVIQVNAAGTLTIQFAQNASDGSASTVLANQYLQLVPIS